MKVSLVIPAYNEEARLEPFLKTVADFFVRRRGLISEVIIVDDGSTDATVAVANRFRQRLSGLRVLKHQRNRGKGAAVQTGVMAARGEAVVFMDADGATPIGELPKMVQALEGADLAVGNRWMAGAVTERHSGLRRLAGWTYRTYMRLFGLGAIDTMCGFKGYRAPVARNLFRDLLEPRWLFDTEVAYKAIRRGYRVSNFPIRWESKDGSKLSAITLFTSAVRIYPLISRIKRSMGKGR